MKAYPFSSAKVLGSITNGVIPDGTYWLVELQGEGLNPLYWTDTFNPLDNSNFNSFAYVANYAACFGSKKDAEVAWQWRGCAEKLPILGRSEVLFLQHVWDSLPIRGEN